MRQQQLSRLVGIVWYKCQVHAYREKKKSLYVREWFAHGAAWQAEQWYCTNTLCAFTFFFFFFCSAILNAEIHSDIRSQHFTISTVNDLRDDSGFWTNPQVNAGIHTTPFTVTPKVDTSSHYTHHKTQCVRKRHACAINLVKLKPGAL